jgi:hypothetical protein
MGVVLDGMVDKPYLRVIRTSYVGGRRPCCEQSLERKRHGRDQSGRPASCAWPYHADHTPALAAPRQHGLRSDINED